jgi:signal peptidase II
MSASRKRDLFALAIGLAVVLVDQLTKAWIVQYFGVVGGMAPIPIVGQFLSLFYLRNTGVAFSLFAGQNIRFALIFVALALIGYLYWRFRDTSSLWLRLGFGLVLGGAIGNLLDRFTRGYVVDFIHFQIPRVFDFAVFNVADSAITVGVVVIAAVLFLITSAPPSGSPALERDSVSSGERAADTSPARARSGDPVL